jgi:mediator of RNA polymerase II transcription subunit 5
MLLRMSTTLFSHAISACADKKMDPDVLHNGVSYFLGPLLHWTLVGVIKTLLEEILWKG